MNGACIMAFHVTSALSDSLHTTDTAVSKEMERYMHTIRHVQYPMVLPYRRVFQSRPP